ncbi:MAG: dihydrofolate reductase family protein [Mycobacterium sp.]
MAAAWPARAGDPFADRMNEIPKYVASRTLSADDLSWPGSVLLPADDAIGAIRELRARDGKLMQVMGSASLAAQLIEHDLVDEYRLMIEPILLGGAKRLFPCDGAARALDLVSTTTTGTGVLICTYRRRWVPTRPTKGPCGRRRTRYALVQVTGSTVGAGETEAKGRG